jgi:hypothetical protein
MGNLRFSIIALNINIYFLFIPRNCTTALKECVPILATYEALKSQFDWLSDGGVSKLVDQNLPIELGRMEMYVR